MQLKSSGIISFIFAVWILASGCYTKCNVVCGTYAELLSIGYTPNELNTVIINYYTPDSSFSQLVKSSTITADSTLGTYWIGLFAQSGSSAADTLGNKHGDANIEFDNTVYDIEVIIPSNNNKVYRISKITFIGYQSENQLCPNGADPMPGGCNRFLASYVINGTVVTNTSINNYTMNNYIYFQK